MNKTQARRLIRTLQPKTFGARSTQQPIIKKLPKGVYNHNFVAQINDQRYVLKVFGGDLPGSVVHNNGKDEATALDLLKDHEAVPEKIHYQTTPELLIYTYCRGKPLKRFTNALVVDLAKTLATIHKTKKTPFTKRKETINTFLESAKLFIARSAALGADRQQVSRFNQALTKLTQLYAGQKTITHPYCLVHGDLAPCNIIVNNNKAKIIDWQGPVMTDPAWDVWAITGKLYAAWDKVKPLTGKQRQLFFTTYFTHRADKTLIARLRQKQPLLHLYLGTYCLYRHTLYKQGRLPQERLRGRKHHWHTYKRIAKHCLKALDHTLTTRKE